jgi:hypothetical protein
MLNTSRQNYRDKQDSYRTACNRRQKRNMANEENSWKIVTLLRKKQVDNEQSYCG